MSILYLDLETYSEVPITHGTHAYAEKAEILLVAHAVDDNVVIVEPFCKDGGLYRLTALISDATTIVIHNSHFDRTVLRHAFFGLELPIEKIHDTMAQAYAHGLPGSLDTLSEVFGLSEAISKDKRGKQLIQLFCKPRPKSSKLRRATAETHPEEWQQFCEYAKRDIEAMRAIYKRMPRWNYPHMEHALWTLDQHINDRGCAIDLDLADAAINAVAVETGRLADRSHSLTQGKLESTTQRDKMILYLAKECGVNLYNLQASTVERCLEDPTIDAVFRELLTIRLQATTVSVRKYKKLRQAVSSDGRLRGTLQFCGASRTGRWAGRVFQPHNLPKPTLPSKEIEEGIRAIKLGCADLITDNVMELLSNALRGVLIPSAGKKLVIADLSNIEGRVLAWLAGEAWKTEAYANGEELYKLAYVKAFGGDVSTVTEEQRTLGKTMELALGYQGAVGAFGTMARLLGIQIEDEEALVLVKAWRAANPKIVKFWYEMDRIVRKAIVTPNHGYVWRRLKIIREGEWLRIILPSGRSLCYAAPRIEEGDITYKGAVGRSWVRLKTYGGKIVENITQAVARDIMAYGMVLAEENGFEVLLSVHDELITENIDGMSGICDGDYLAELMSTNPPWADGLPLAAKSFETYRYRKG